MPSLRVKSATQDLVDAIILRAAPIVFANPELSNEDAIQRAIADMYNEIVFNEQAERFDYETSISY